MFTLTEEIVKKILCSTISKKKKKGNKSNNNKKQIIRVLIKLKVDFDKCISSSDFGLILKEESYVYPLHFPDPLHKCK